MNRRSFLSLLVAAPAIPALAKLAAITTREAAPFVPPVVPPAPVAFDPNLVRLPRIATAVMNFNADEGFDPLIAPGRIARFTAIPQMLFRPRRLLVAGDASPFELIHVAASGAAQLDEAVPAELFSPVAYAPQMYFDTVQTGDLVVLAVRNRSNEPAFFQAAMIGDVPDDRPYEEPTREQIFEEARAWDRELAEGSLEDERDLDDDEHLEELERLADGLEDLVGTGRRS